MSQDKLKKLKRILAGMGRVLIGFSGGVDSAVLSCVAQETLKDKAYAVTAQTNFLPECERRDAVRIARKFNLHHAVAAVRLARICQDNPVDRCYHCKKNIFSRLARIAKKRNIRWVIDGSNRDDSKEFRPGKKALNELKVRSPLQEAGLNKADIRRLARSMGIDIWNKPAYTCLATRIPYGQRITAAKLAMVSRAEEVLRAAGFMQVRVRCSDEVARIEVLKKDIPRLIRKAASIAGKLKKLGFSHVTVDLQGYCPAHAGKESAWKSRK